MTDAPYAVFLIGGAANGKSTALRLQFRVVPNRGQDQDEDEDEDLPVLHADRKLDPDDYKTAIPMFTFALDDDDAYDRFHRRGLGGPSGPLTRTEYERYPAPVRQVVEASIESWLGIDLPGFVEGWLTEENPNFPDDEDWKFGGGLTHELSKALAQADLGDVLDEVPPRASFAWDAIGNAETYRGWIERALESGYLVRVLYVQAPLPVAHMWAAERRRKLPPALIDKTYRKAAEAAEALQRYVWDFGDPVRLAFQRVSRGDDVLVEAQAEGYTAAGPPAG